MSLTAPPIDAWIFDLDNTLYPASCNLFEQVDRRMGQYIAKLLAVPHDDARRLQKHYFREYGTTLRGLMVEHAIDPIPFLEFVHDIDVRPVPPDTELWTLLGQLPGRKYVYTNGSTHHAENVMQRLGVADRFDGVFDIVAAAFVPKPDPRPYAAMVNAFGIDPNYACMIEDIARNLKPAKELGMSTVWLRSDIAFAKPQGDDLCAVDEVIDDLNEWLREQVSAFVTGAMS